MHDAVEKFIKDLLKSDNSTKPTLILGLSGGPDSMALFHILKDLQKKLGFRLISAHVNHMFRGAQADAEEKDLIKMTRAAGEIFESLRVDVHKIAEERKTSGQDAGHQVRKEFFTKLARKYASKYVVLGHHQDDRVESFFLHLLHGAGSQGLTAMPKVGAYAGEVRVIRPLMDVRKEEILEYCHQREIPYFQDPSNEKAVYKRNKVRLELIPQLEKEYNPKIREVILRSVEIMEDEDDFLKEVTATKFAQLVTKTQPTSGRGREPGEFVLDKKEFQKLHKGIQRRLLIKILEELSFSQEKKASNQHEVSEQQRISYNFEKIEKLIQLLGEEKGQRSYKLSQDYKMEITYTEAIFKKAGKESPASEVGKDFEVRIDLLKLEKEGSLTVQTGSQRFTFTSEGTLSFGAGFPQGAPCGKDASKRSVPSASLHLFADSITLRTRRDGDIIKPLGGKTKKLKKFLIEKKIPQDQRDQLILLALDKEVIWIPNLVRSEHFAPSSTTDDVHNKNNIEQTGKKMLKVACTGEREFEKKPSI